MLNVEIVEALGFEAFAHGWLRASGPRVIARLEAQDAKRVQAGEALPLSVAPSHVHLFDPATRARARRRAPPDRCGRPCFALVLALMALAPIAAAAEHVDPLALVPRGRGAGARGARAALRAPAPGRRRRSAGHPVRGVLGEAAGCDPARSRARPLHRGARAARGVSARRHRRADRRRVPGRRHRDVRHHGGPRDHARRRAVRGAALEQMPRALRERGPASEDTRHAGGDRFH